MSDLNQIDILGNSSIGLFGIATDNYVILPNNVKKKTREMIETTLNVPIVTTSIANCNLIGLFSAVNNHHIILPNLISENEYNLLQAELPDDTTIHIVDSKITAFGNAIVASDNVALIHPEFTKDEQVMIADLLDVEVESRTILNSPLVGSMVFQNQHGLLTHPLISDTELQWLCDFFKTTGDVVTVNKGTPYPRPGIIANNHGVLAGSDTSGPELMRIYEVLLSTTV